MPATPPAPQPSDASRGDLRHRRSVAIGIAAACVAFLVGGLVVLANRDGGDATSDTPPATSPTVDRRGTAPVTAPGDGAGHRARHGGRHDVVR